MDTMATHTHIIKKLATLANKNKAKTLRSFFKTCKGEYAEGDMFLGITVPIQRKVAKEFFKNIPLTELSKLLQSKIHEHRFTALEMLVMKFDSSFSVKNYQKSKTQKYQQQKDARKIAQFYLKHTKHINNWDLVDTSARYILGAYIRIHGKNDTTINTTLLIKLARSKNMWERRIAIVSTHDHIANKDAKLALQISEMLINDPHDLIHKATGWMLREIGKHISKETLKKFLKSHAQKMPSIMRSYALEHFTKEERIEFARK